jgi:hypothetical protein
MFDSYVEYGRRLERLIEEIKTESVARFHAPAVT